MQSTPTLQETDPHDSFLIEPDVVLAARANPTPPDPAQVRDVLSRFALKAAQAKSEASAATVSNTPAPTAPTAVKTSTPTVDTTFRAAAVGAAAKRPGERSAFAKWAKNTSIAFLFAFCSAVAAATWKHHSDTAKQMIADWVPPYVLAMLSPTEASSPAPQSDSPPVQAATADSTAPASTTPASTTPASTTPASTAPAQPAQSVADAAPTSAAAPADSTPSVQSMARDLASMGQQIEQLKATIEQLKTGQAQMAREVARATELNLRARVASLPPRVAPVRKPKPAYPPAQQAAAVAPLQPPSSVAAPAPLPLSQSQGIVQSDGGPVVRPPMPLR